MATIADTGAVGPVEGRNPPLTEHDTFTRLVAAVNSGHRVEVPLSSFSSAKSTRGRFYTWRRKQPSTPELEAVVVHLEGKGLVFELSGSRNPVEAVAEALVSVCEKENLQPQAE